MNMTAMIHKETVFEDLAPTPFTGVRLDANERSQDWPPELKNRLADWVRHMPLQRYPDDTLLKKDLAEYWGLQPANIVVGSGSDELIQIICLSLAVQKNLIFPIPTFSMYNQCAQLAGARPVPVPLKDDFSLDGLAMLAAARRYPGPMVICQPNNPTGRRFDDETLRRILDKTSDPVIIDEAYGEFTGQNYRAWMDRYPHLILLRTFSKAMGMAGLRVGYGMMSESMAQTLNRVKPPYNVSSISLQAARLALYFPDFWKNALPEVNRERERVTHFLAQRFGFRVYPSETNFILFSPPGSADRVWAECRRRGVLLRNLSNTPGLDNHLRVSVGSRSENDLFLEVLDRIFASSPSNGGAIHEDF